ncbi:hypothetical protein N2152v2_001239 [Parachlorella kessleri]
MIRLLTLGAAVVAVAAVKQKRGRQEPQGDAPREAPLPVHATPAVQTLAPQAEEEEAPLAKPAGTATVVVTTAPRPIFPPGSQLLLRLVVSLLAAALLHTVLGRDTPWSSLLITSLALFVLTEHLYRTSSPPQPAPVRHETARLAVHQPLRQQPPQPAVVAQPVPLQNFSGLWVKDKEASESMEAACNLMQMGSLLRTAIRLIKGLRIRQLDGEFEMAVLSGILWFKVVETYPLDGTPRKHKRRDLRRGTHVASLHPMADGSLQMRLAWSDPLGGDGVDTFHCPAADTLWVDTVLTVGGQTVQYRQVYRRQQ